MKTADPARLSGSGTVSLWSALALLLLGACSLPTTSAAPALLPSMRWSAAAPVTQQGTQQGTQQDAPEEDVHIPLWPLMEWSTKADGSEHLSALFLFDHETGPNGETEHLRIVNWMTGPGYTLFIPLYYNLGPEGERDTGIFPIFLWGPGYGVAPLFLSWWWEDPDGSSATWITPLYHHTRNTEGEIVGQHLLTYYRGEDGWVAFPLAYIIGPEGEEDRGLLLLYHDGPGYWVSPVLLSGAFQNTFGGRSTWITPLYHSATNGEEVVERHVLTYFEGPGYRVLLPIGYDIGPPEDRHRGLLLAYHDGPDYRMSPLLLSGQFGLDTDTPSTWITPLVHWTDSPDGVRDFHILTYFQGPDYKVFFPLAYSYGPEGQKKRGLIPFWFSDDEFWAVPVALSGGWLNPDGGWSNWITPLFHHRDNPNGQDSYHALLWFEGPDYQVLFPLWYRYDDNADGGWGLFPLWHQEANAWASPVLLSGHGENGYGGSTTWITPLLHWSTDSDGLRDFHFANYFQGPDYKVFFPLAWSVGSGEQRSRGIFPLYMEGPDYGTSPLLLSGWWTAEDGDTSTWITPFYHHTYGPPLPTEVSSELASEATLDPSTAQAEVLRSRHFFNWYQSEDLSTFFPLYWNYSTDEGHRRNMLLPFFWQTDYADGDSVTSILPPLIASRSGAELNTELPYQFIPFSYQEAGEEGQDWEFNFLWRLFHLRQQGDVKTTTIGPLWYSESKPGLPTDYKILGGLFARDVFETRGTVRYRALWFLSFGEEELSKW